MATTYCSLMSWKKKIMACHKQFFCWFRESSRLYDWHGFLEAPKQSRYLSLDKDGHLPMVPTTSICPMQTRNSICNLVSITTKWTALIWLLNFNENKTNSLIIDIILLILPKLAQIVSMEYEFIILQPVRWTKNKIFKL